jgi:hypothetical protein
MPVVPGPPRQPGDPDVAPPPDDGKNRPSAGTSAEVTFAPVPPTLTSSGGSVDLH